MPPAMHGNLGTLAMPGGDLQKPRLRPGASCPCMQRGDFAGILGVENHRLTAPVDNEGSLGRDGVLMQFT